YLDANLERGGGVVFVLAGSSGSTIETFKERIAVRPKGTDVLSRVPDEWEIPPLDAGDRILVVLSQMLNSAEDVGRPIAAVEKLALYYVSTTSRLGNARQLREFAVRAVTRGSATDDRVHYDDLFESGDGERYRFREVTPDADALTGTFIRVAPRQAADQLGQR